VKEKHIAFTKFVSQFFFDPLTRYEVDFFRTFFLIGDKFKTEKRISLNYLLF